MGNVNIVMNTIKILMENCAYFFLECLKHLKQVYRNDYRQTVFIRKSHIDDH